MQKVSRFLRKIFNWGYHSGINGVQAIYHSLGFKEEELHWIEGSDERYIIILNGSINSSIDLINCISTCHSSTQYSTVNMKIYTAFSGFLRIAYTINQVLVSQLQTILCNFKWSDPAPYKCGSQH